MKKVLSILFIFFYSSCTFVSVIDSEVENIDLSKLRPETIDSDLATINLLVDQDEFDYMYENYREDIEIEAEIEIWRKNNGIRTKSLDKTDVEIKIRGAASAVPPLKSIGIKFDNTADNSSGNIFSPIVDPRPNISFDKIKSLRARNSGQDLELTLLKDITYANLAIYFDLDFESGYFEPTHVFINSSYYGLLNLRSEKNQNGLSRQLGVKKDDIYQIKINWGDTLDFKGTNTDLLEEYVEAVENEDLDYLEQKTDIESFIDYMVFQDISGNHDWPHNNTLLYYNIKEANPKFRFFLYDLDLAGNETHFIADRIDEDIFMLKLLRTLLKNPDTKELLSKRQNQIFIEMESKKFHELVDVNSSLIENDMKYQIKKYHFPKDRAVWHTNLNKLKNKYDTRILSYRDYIISDLTE